MDKNESKCLLQLMKFDFDTIWCPKVTLESVKSNVSNFYNDIGDFEVCEFIKNPKI